MPSRLFNFSCFVWWY